MGAVNAATIVPMETIRPATPMLMPQNVVKKNACQVASIVLAIDPRPTVP